MTSNFLCFGILTWLPLLVLGRIPNMRNNLFDNQNAIPSPGKFDGGEKDVEFRDWVKVSQDAKRVVHVAAGERVEFECEAFGSPSPTVQWSRGSHPQHPVYEESNNIGGISLGKAISRLVFDCAMPFHQGIYTCMASTVTKTATSQSTTLLVHVHNTNLTSILTKCKETRPRIVQWNPIVMETIGNDATLPCRAKGSSSLEIYWIDKEEKLVSNDPDSRYKILDSGDLLITKVQWSDMGGYTCVAQDTLGRDSETTFLYPMDNE